MRPLCDLGVRNRSPAWNTWNTRHQPIIAPEAHGRDRSPTHASIERWPRACLLGVFAKLREGAQIEIVGIEALGRLAGRPLDFRLAELRFNRADDAARYLVLQLEDVVEHAVEAVCPDVSPSRRVDQLAGNAHTVTGLADASFEHIAHPEFTSDLAQIGRFALVCKARITRDHEYPW